MAYKDKDQENQYKNQWQRENKDRVVILIPKGQKAEITEAVKAGNYKSVNAWINEAINDKLKDS